MPDATGLAPTSRHHDSGSISPERFRSDLREWLDALDLDSRREESLTAEVAHVGKLRAALHEAGWMRYGWPLEVGGLGGPALLRSILGEEIAERELAHPAVYSVVEVLAPTLITYAPELAKVVVPQLLSGREHWCQGFSEPGSGSDLASLSTRATPHGDGWIVNGSKVWTSLAQFSARCLLLARTSPSEVSGHKTMSAFLVDMDTPGITVRPLRTMHGVDEFAEIHFEDVVVPGDRLLGRPGDGWALAMDLLPYERSTCFWHRIAYLFTRFDRLLADTAELDSGADTDIGAAMLAMHIARCRSHATQRRFSAGDRLGPETSIDKILLSTAEQTEFDTVRNLLPGIIELDEGSWRTEFLYSRSATIYGGTAEIQRNIVARRLLELGPE